jgi:hypothetical protein
MADNVGAISAESGTSRTERIEAGLGSSRYKEYGLAGYASVVQARIPRDIWSAVFFAWLSLKGHIQGLHEFDRSQCFVTVGKDGHIDATFVVVWESAEALSEWLEHGFCVERTLLSMGIPRDDVRVKMMRDFS